MIGEELYELWRDSYWDVCAFQLPTWDDLSEDEQKAWDNLADKLGIARDD